MSSDKPSSVERIGNSLRTVQSFLRGKSLPGTVRLRRGRDKEGTNIEHIHKNGEINNTSIQLNQHKEEDHNAQTINKHEHDCHVSPMESHEKMNSCLLSPIERHQIKSNHVELDRIVEEYQKNNNDNDKGDDDDDGANSSGQQLKHNLTDSQNMNIRSASSIRVAKFNKILENTMISISELRELAWSGLPPKLRPKCWKLLLGYLPPNKDRQTTVLTRKRREYQNLVPGYYDISNNFRSEEELGALRQVSVDVPRTAPGVHIFQTKKLQKSLERILYIWGIRHPASGYVQGMNDLVTPFLTVFVSEHCEGPLETWDIDTLSDEILLNIEADCYWCLCKLLDSIQDHYTTAQPGIQKAVFKVRELVRRIDESIANHLDEQGIDFLQFAFRWVNCLLVRELPNHLTIRLWDTYLAEGPKFNEFLVYVCAAFLLNWSNEIKSLEFQDIVMFLQRLPTSEWTEEQMELILSKAFMYRTSFEDSKSHLVS